MNWYVLNTLSYKTNQVVFNLNKRKCIEAFVPQYEYYHRKTKEYLTAEKINEDIEKIFAK